MDLAGGNVWTCTLMRVKSGSFFFLSLAHNSLDISLVRSQTYITLLCWPQIINLSYPYNGNGIEYTRLTMSTWVAIAAFHAYVSIL